MLSFRVFNYTYIIDPSVVPEILNEMWAKEPVGSMGIAIALGSLLLTLAFKLLDYWWEAQRERARQGRLRLELTLETRTEYTDPVLMAHLSNAGKEPIVIRDVGMLQTHWWRREFESLMLPSGTLPHALNTYDLYQIVIPLEAVDPERLRHGFYAKDSLGRLWHTQDGDIRRVLKQLRQRNLPRANTSQAPPAAQEAAAYNNTPDAMSSSTASTP